MIKSATVNNCRLFLTCLMAISMGMMTAACEGPEGPDGLQGPQGEQGAAGSQGEQGPQGVPGEDGNANVTVHIFDGNDFSENLSVHLCLGENISQQEMIESSWNVYLGVDFGFGSLLYWHVPGTVGSSEYWALNYYDIDTDICLPEQPLIEVQVISGTGHEIDEIRVVQVVAGNIIDHRGKLRGAPSSELPDVANYHALVDYFGNSVKIVRH